MKLTLGNEKDFTVPLVASMLDGVSPPGSAGMENLRIKLNVSHGELGVPARMGGWRKLGMGNEDLHDQLLGGQGWWALITEAASISGGTAESSIKVDDWEWILPDDHITIAGHELLVTSSVNGTVIVVNNGTTFAVAPGDVVIKRTPGQREAFTTLFPCKSSGGTRYLVAFTRSRVYVTTGSALNWRIIADGLGGGYRTGDDPFGGHRWDVDKLGEYVVFTNNYDPVMAWKIGASAVTTGSNKRRRWSAFEVYDLLGLGITAAGAVWASGGFLFLGDVVVNGTRYSDRIYWCDFNRPLEWAPGGESAAGYSELGGGQVVLRGATIGDSQRVYTDTTIYSGTLVGGDVVFRFLDVYSGGRALKHKWSLVNAGDTHYYLSGEGMVALSKFDPSPNQPEWLQRAGGLIKNGLDAALLRQAVPSISPFGKLAEDLCSQIAVGYHGDKQEVWVSWPTATADSADISGVRRSTLRISVKHGQASLVDHSFSAFAQWSPDHRMSIRDFMVTYCVCSAPGVVDPKEGIPLNEVTPACDGLYGLGTYSGPDHIYNEQDDGTGVPSNDSICAVIGDLSIDDLCPECVESSVFVAASLGDLCLKQMSDDFMRREMYSEDDDESAAFPYTSPGAYVYEGYPTLIQSEMSEFGYWNDKLVSAVGIAFSATDGSQPGQIRCQVSANNSPQCGSWHDADPIALSCLPSGATPDQHIADGTRADELPRFAFHTAGVYAAYRIWVEGQPTITGGDGPASPVDCAFSMFFLKWVARPFRSHWQKIK